MQNVATEASLQTKLVVWWAGVPFVTRCTVVACVAVYLVSLFVGFDDMAAVCLMSGPVLRGQVYRFFTAAVVHVGILHLAFNMLALLPIGASLERSLGSLQFLWIIMLLCVLGDLAYVAIAYLSTFLPSSSWSFLDFAHQCTVGFSGVIFGLVLIDNHTRGGATRSIFGLFSVPAKAYPWVLLLVWQFIIPQASFLGHLTGLLVGELYVLGMLRWVLLSSSAYQRIERSACSTCLHSPCFIAHTAGSGGDAGLPVSRSPGAGYQAMGTGSPSHTSGWFLGSWMPFPPSSDRLSSLFNFTTQEQQVHVPQQQQSSQGTRLGGGQQPADARAAAAVAAEARMASQAARGTKPGSNTSGAIKQPGCRT